MNCDKFIKILTTNGFQLKRNHGGTFIYHNVKTTKMVSIHYHKGKDMHKGMARRLLKECDIKADIY